MKALSRGFMLTILGLSCGAHAESLLVWRDGKGLGRLESCRESLQSEISLKVADPTEVALGSRETIRLQEKALVRSLKANPQSTRVQLLGGANSSHYRVEGLIQTQKLQTLDDYVLEIQDAHAGSKLKGKYLQVAIEDGRYKTMTCGAGKAAQKFVVYNVFNAENQNPVGRVGVAENESLLFKSIKIYTSEQADLLLNHQLQEKQNSASSSVAPAPSSSQTFSGGAGPVGGSGGDEHRGQHLITKIPLNIRPGSGDGPASGEAAAAVDSEVAAQPLASPATPAEVAASGTAIDSVVCLSEGTLSVRDESLKTILFQANKLEIVKVAQGFSAPKDPRYIKVQFTNRPSGKNTGWVAKEFIQLKSECAGTKSAVQEQKKKADDAANSAAASGSGRGLSDGCCSFPLAKRPTTSYKEGMRRFGWARGRGRIHAACDLYGGVGDAVNAVKDGVIIRGPYAFYGGVYAVEAVHTGGFVVRYGEVLGKVASGISSGVKITKGRTVGYVGRVRGHGSLEPMLHFELYSGKVDGPLTQRARRGYQRRADLLNPTGYLSQWEQSTFGDSY